MAFNKIACKSSDFRVVFTIPDFCLPPPPDPPVAPPIPFPLFTDFGGAQTVANDVRLNRKPAFVFKASTLIVRRGCITTSSGIMSLMRGGVTHWGYLFQQSFIWEILFEELIMKKKEIILSMQTAFLGAICNKVRLIAFDMTEELFTLYVYIDSPLTDDEYEVIDSAVTDVLADFPNFLYEKIYIIENNDNILLLNMYKGCFFMRFENKFD